MKTHLDVCSGIGGFALAAQWTGYTTVGFVEIEPWCRRVLAKNFPEAKQHDDIWTLTAATVRDWIGERANHVADANFADGEARSTDRMGTSQPTGAHSRTGELDLITGGYPCQPFSLAGKRLGAEDDRHLWPAIAALVADLRPARCLFENVAGHVTMGLDAVLSDLDSLGYTCWPVVIPAAAVGAPHRRDRVWIIAAHTDSHSEPTVTVDGDTGRGIVGAQDVADAAARGVRRGSASGQPGQPALGGEDVADAGCRDGDGWPGDAGGNDANGTDTGWPEGSGGTHERDCGREALGGVGDEADGLPGLVARSGWRVGPDILNPWAGDWEADCPRTTDHEVDRTHKLKALGNAIVPAVAYEILRAWEAA